MTPARSHFAEWQMKRRSVASSQLARNRPQADLRPTTTSYCRSTAEQRQKEALRVVDVRKAISDEMLAYLRTFGSLRKFLDTHVVGIEDAIGTMSAKDAVHRDTRTRKMVACPFGSSLRDFRSRRGLPSAIISVVEAIKALHERETHHRDISLRNILLSDEENENGERKGLLIDLDYEIQAGKKIADLCNRTGTVPFMAFELLNTDLEVPHGYYHDLESVFYVLCYVCCTSAGPNGFTREDFDLARSDLQCWFPQMGRAMKFTAFMKEKTVGDEVQFETGILGSFGQYFDVPALKEYMQELRHLLFPPKVTDMVRRQHAVRGEPLPLFLCPCSELKPSYVFGTYKHVLRKMYDSVEEPEAFVMTAPGDEPAISTLARVEEKLH